jgi:phage tail sheath gpL-like
MVYDSGSVSLTVNGATKTVNYSQYSNAPSMAMSLYTQINNDNTFPVRAYLSYSNAISSYADVMLTAKTTGPGTCYTVTTSYTYNTDYFRSPSFQIHRSGAALVGCK